MEAKTVQDIINDLRSRYGITISVPLACRLINDAVSELVTLYSTALVPIDVDMANVKAGVPQILPTMGVYKVTTDGEAYKRYTADSNSITFQNDGDYTVSALLIPDNVAKADDDIPVHLAYHPCILQYVSFYAKPAEDKQANNSQFYSLSQEIHNRLSNTKRKGRRIPARLWR